MSATILDDKHLLMMKAKSFEISLATSLSKFGGRLSILCAFLRWHFLKHLQISDGQGVSQVLFDDVIRHFPNLHEFPKSLHYLKRWFYDIVHLDLSIFFRFLYLSFINYFCHVMFYSRDSLSVFTRDFPCSSFPLILQISGRTYCYFKLNEKMFNF